MKAILEFNLPEETSEHENALNGISYKISIEEFDNWLRGLSKYCDQDSISTEEARKKLFDILKDNGVGSFFE